MRDVTLIEKNLLDLQSQFDNLDGRGCGLRQKGSDSSEGEFEEEAVEFVVIVGGDH